MCIRDSNSTEISKIVPALIDALKDYDNDVQRRAVETLVKIGVDAVPYLINALNDENENVRENTAWAIGKIAEANPGNTEISKIVPALIDALKDEDLDVRRNAAWAIGKIGFENVPEEKRLEVKVLTLLLLEKTDEIIKIGEDAVPHLIDALNDENEYVREKAAEAIEKIVENFVNKKIEEMDYKAALSTIENTASLILKMYKNEFSKKGKKWDLVKERKELIEKLNSLATRVKEKVEELSNQLNKNELMKWKPKPKEDTTTKNAKICKTCVR